MPDPHENSSDPVLSVRDLRVSFVPADTSRPTVQAVDGVDLDLHAGQVHALVGESGSGKSVTAMTVLGLTRSPRTRVSGSIRYAGRELVDLPEPEFRRLRGAEMSMVFQDPMTSLNPLHRVGRQVAETLQLHEGLDRRAAAERAVEALDAVGIRDPRRAVRSYPHEFSGGMRQRVMIAIALACRPKVLLADEPTTALDVTIQRQVLRLMTDLTRSTGTAVLLVTHDLGVVAQYADEVSVMNTGKVVEAGDVRQVVGDPRHAYTQGLLAAVPRLHGPRPRRLSAGARSTAVTTARTPRTPRTSQDGILS
ncbi:ABC transporter ATP-binding protein [Kineococcus sp. SYSU DK003]|uniref:ABC transporter ATP-binding protein n=1 Tax=Kineococcus sp. SYSU DK003 TaxID=3383124 RepID=UPI003D7D5773